MNSFMNSDISLSDTRYSGSKRNNRSDVGFLHSSETNLLSQAQVQVILQEFLIVSSQVKANRECGRWMNSSTSDVEG